MKKFRAINYGSNPISEVEVERATKTSVWINGQRCAKISGHQKYCDTWKDAHSFLLDIAEKEVASKEFRLKHAIKRLNNIKALKPES